MATEEDKDRRRLVRNANHADAAARDSERRTAYFGGKNNNPEDFDREARDANAAAADRQRGEAAAARAELRSKYGVTDTDAEADRLHGASTWE